MQIRTQAGIAGFCVMVTLIALAVTHVISWAGLRPDVFRQVFVLHTMIVLCIAVPIALWGGMQIRKGTRGLDRLRHLADHDDMTGLLNRRRILHLLAERGQAAGQIVILDIDHFKSINDRFGHATGDRVIIAVAQGMRAVVRAQDIIGRFGGEEFILFLAGTDAASGIDRAEAIRSHIEGLHVLQNPHDPVTISIGLADLLPGQEVDVSLKQADQALYAAKAAGRNRVCHFDLIAPENEIAKRCAAQ